jgi:ABC-2 type transport system permease protein
MQQSVVSVYCDMSLMLTYKAAYQTALAVSQTMNKEIQIQLAGRYTKREEQIQAAPLQCDDVALYNPGGGYGSAILPAVLMLILQQTLVLGIGMAAGTARETNRFSDLVPIQSHYHGTFRIVLGKSMAYFMIYAVMGTWLTVVVPRLFNFPHLAQWYNLLMLMLPYTLACIFFGITVSCLVRYRENVMLLMVFVSIPLLFLSGASWPQSAIPGFWQGISWLFPSTFGVRAYVRLNSMGGSIGDVLFEYHALWLHVLVYFIVACLVYRHHVNFARRHAEELKTE